MTHINAPTPRFLVFDEGIVNVHDISTARPYREDSRRPSTELPADGVRITMQSKAVWLDLPGQTLKGLESRLNGAVF